MVTRSGAAIASANCCGPIERGARAAVSVRPTGGGVDDDVSGSAGEPQLTSVSTAPTMATWTRTLRINDITSTIVLSPIVGRRLAPARRRDDAESLIALSHPRHLLNGYPQGVFRGVERR